jgi:hypothetical protein
MKKYLAFGFVLLAAAGAFAQQDRPSPLDGNWKGRSNGGSCNAPLDYDITIESGLVDGSAYDTSARGPVPNTKKGPPPAPTPGLWQIHGLARPGTFSLLAVASVKGTDRREGRLTATAQGNTLTITESGGCGRVAQLSRG